MKKGGLNTILTLAAVAGGGYLIYHLFVKKALAARTGPADTSPTVVYQNGKQYWYGTPTAGYANRVWLNAAGEPEPMGPPAPGGEAAFYAQK